MRITILLLTCISIACITIARTGTANALETLVSIYPTLQEISTPGTTVEVNVTITDTPSIVQWMVRIQWNSTVLKIVNPDTDLIEGDFLKSNGSTIFTWKPLQPGKIPEITCGYLVDKTKSGSGTLFTIKFNATAVGETAIEIYGSDLLDRDGYSMPHSRVNGTVTIIPEFPALLLPLILIATTTIALMAATVSSRKRRCPIRVP